jgi:hypothetical protein
MNEPTSDPSGDATAVVNASALLYYYLIAMRATCGRKLSPTARPSLLAGFVALANEGFAMWGRLLLSSSLTREPNKLGKKWWC